MRKTYSINGFLEVAKKKIFDDLFNNTSYVNIFEVIKLWSGDYLPVSQMKSGPFWVYWGWWKTNQTHLESNVKEVTLWIGRVGARCGCVFKIEWPAWVTDNALYASYISKDYDLDFLMHYLNFANLNQYANTAAQPVIGLKRISNVTIPKIDITKQKEIADLLFRISNWSYLLEEGDNFNLKKVIDVQQNFSDISENLELCHKYIWNLRSAILREAVQGNLVAQNLSEWNARDLLDQIQKEREQSISGKKSKKIGIKSIDPGEIPFEIPKNWAWCRMSDLIINHMGWDWWVDQLPDWIQVRVLRSPDVRFWFIDFEAAEVRYLTKEAFKRQQLIDWDILIIKSNGSRDLVWKSQIYFQKEWYENTVASNFLLRITPSSKISYHYFDYLLKSSISQKWRFDAQSTTTGLRNLNTTEFFNMIVPLPPYDEQNRIAQKIYESMEKIQELEASINGSENLSERLLKVGLKEVFNS